MNLTEKFYWQLKQGNEGEKIVAEFLEENLNCKVIGYNNNKKFDLKVLKNNKEYLFEIKTDTWDFYKNKMGQGNIFVETKYKGKPSGLLASNSNYYAFYFPYYEKLLIVSKEELKKNIHKGHFTYNGGDDGNSDGVLLNIFSQDFMKEYHIPIEKYEKTKKEDQRI